jgi:hypothetical protein
MTVSRRFGKELMPSSSNIDTLILEDDGTAFLRNVGCQSSNDRGSEPKKYESSKSL